MLSVIPTPDSRAFTLAFDTSMNSTHASRASSRLRRARGSEHFPRAMARPLCVVRGCTGAEWGRGDRGGLRLSCAGKISAPLAGGLRASAGFLFGLRLTAPTSIPRSSEARLRGWVPGFDWGSGTRFRSRAPHAPKGSRFCCVFGGLEDGVAVAGRVARGPGARSVGLWMRASCRSGPTGRGRRRSRR